MLNQTIKLLYENIKNQLFYMIPEKWSKIYLYASIMKRINQLETGEMFFYYFPKGVLRKNPVNVYEVPNKFNIEEDSYMRLADQLYGYIKELREVQILQGEEPWSSMTLKIEDSKFKIEYCYENLLESKYSSVDRHLIWQYENLDYPIERMSKQQREMLLQYIEEQKRNPRRKKVYTEGIYQKEKIHNLEYQVEHPDTYILRRKIEKEKKPKKYGEYKKVNFVTEEQQYEQKEKQKETSIEKQIEEQIKKESKKSQILNQGRKL